MVRFIHLKLIEVFSALRFKNNHEYKKDNPLYSLTFVFLFSLYGVVLPDDVTRLLVRTLILVDVINQSSPTPIF